MSRASGIERSVKEVIQYEKGNIFKAMLILLKLWNPLRSYVLAIFADNYEAASSLL